MRHKLLCSVAATAVLVASGAAHSADLGVTVKAPPTLWRWTGGYIGGYFGGGYGRTSFTDPFGPSIYGDVVDTPVFVAGGQIGYNWQRERWVFGLELDGSGAISEGTNTCLAASGIIVSANCKAGPDVFATGTGRLGYAFGPQGHTLVYLKGGVAWQHNRGDVVNNREFFGPQNATHFDGSRLGGTIGVGVEQALTPAWSVKLEYDYLRFGGPSVATPPTTQYPSLVVPANITSLNSSYHIGKVGLNYHFGAGPGTPEWSDPPLYATSPTVSVPPIALAHEWSVESGTRAWLSRGRFQWDHPSGADPSSLVSRLTYHKLDGISGELFERIESPWGIFLKGNIGFGRFGNGSMNDEDWAAVVSDEGVPMAYYLTGSRGANGRFTYYTADAGYDFLRGSTYKAGVFVGWTYYGQKSDSIGCIQLALPYYPCHGGSENDKRTVDKRTVGSEDANWNALRIGFTAETMLLDRWRLSAEVAYLPWTDFQGRDNHLYRENTTFVDQRGSGGGGVQLEGVLSYFVTDNFSVGVGARYWAMWTSRGSEDFASGRNGVGTVHLANDAKYSMERWGTFLQASYKFG
ncbi:outer membrane beta-barrel protein [Bradyrhizobium neotropicale]|uniref:outer membrane beta-barrel protein n=1 Tax=Bradyrhizobium neotropicale TaxID=1497615 RepID=UPI001AD703EC|nr:outer membrane beta-barrel protein [Bradyrhizobium neotropicale]MBO4228418.1 outer membrane beta-barrel protein [Bradyrhizobium neotropicale]